MEETVLRLDRQTQLQVASVRLRVHRWDNRVGNDPIAFGLGHGDLAASQAKAIDSRSLERRVVFAPEEHDGRESGLHSEGIGREEVAAGETLAGEERGLWE